MVCKAHHILLLTVIGVCFWRGGVCQAEETRSQEHTFKLPLLKTLLSPDEEQQGKTFEAWFKFSGTVSQEIMDTFKTAAAEYLAEKKKGKRKLDPAAAPLDCLIGLVEAWRIEEAIPLLLEIVDYELDPRSFGVGGSWGLMALYPAASALVELRVEPKTVLAALGEAEKEDSHEAMRKCRLLTWVLCRRVGGPEEAWKLFKKESLSEKAYRKTVELLDRVLSDRNGGEHLLLPPPTGEEDTDRLLPVPKEAEHRRVFPYILPKEKISSTFFSSGKTSETDLTLMEPLTGRAQYRTREYRLFEALWNAFGSPEEIDWLKDDFFEYLPFSIGLVAATGFDITVSPRGKPSSYWKYDLESSFPPGTCQPWIVPVAQRRVVFVVAAGHSMDVLDTTLICPLLREGAEGKTWKDILGKGPNVPVKCFFPPLQSPAMNIIKDRYMGEHRKGKDGGPRVINFRTDAQICSSTQAVMDGVRTSGPAGLGIVELPAAASANWNGVKILSLRGDPGYYWREGPPNEKAIITFSPLLDSMFQLEYPLAETVTLYLPPQAIERLRKFVNFCRSQRAAEIIHKAGYISAWEDKQIYIKRRLAEWKAGKGQTLTLWGVRDQTQLVRAFQLAYVQSYGLAYLPNLPMLQIQWESRQNFREAVEGFLRDGPLLFVEDSYLPPLPHQLKKDEIVYIPLSGLKGLYFLKNSLLWGY